MGFDLEKFIDREFEYREFKRLLELADDERILAIRDAGNMGKSHLLERLSLHCRTTPPRPPVSLISLDQLSDHQPITLVKRIVDDLTKSGIRFPNFRQM